MCPAPAKAALFREAQENRPFADRFRMRDWRELGISERERERERKREREKWSKCIARSKRLKMCVDAQRREFRRYVRGGRLHADVSADPLAVCGEVGSESGPGG